MAGNLPFGLKFVPTAEPRFRDSDSLFDTSLLTRYASIERDNTERVLQKLRELAAAVPAGFGILEIGVALNAPERSITYSIIDGKQGSVVYLGVDIQDKTHVNDASKNVFTLQCDSGNHTVIRNWLKSHGVEALGLLVIDGHHSVTMAVNDWSYCDKVAIGGKVAIHDTNAWLGPMALVTAIDEDFFDTEILFREFADDNGLTVCTRRK